MVDILDPANSPPASFSDAPPSEPPPAPSDNLIISPAAGHPLTDLPTQSAGPSFGPSGSSSFQDPTPASAVRMTTEQVPAQPAPKTTPPFASSVNPLPVAELQSRPAGAASSVNPVSPPPVPGGADDLKPKKKGMGAGLVIGLLLLLITLPIGVYYISQQQSLNDVRNRAATTDGGGGGGLYPAACAKAGQAYSSTLKCCSGLYEMSGSCGIKASSCPDGRSAPDGNLCNCSPKPAICVNATSLTPTRTPTVPTSGSFCVESNGTKLGTVQNYPVYCCNNKVSANSACTDGLCAGQGYRPSVTKPCCTDYPNTLGNGTCGTTPEKECDQLVNKVAAPVAWQDCVNSMRGITVTPNPILSTNCDTYCKNKGLTVGSLAYGNCYAGCYGSAHQVGGTTPTVSYCDTICKDVPSAQRSTCYGNCYALNTACTTGQFFDWTTNKCVTKPAGCSEVKCTSTSCTVGSMGTKGCFVSYYQCPAGADLSVAGGSCDIRVPGSTGTYGNNGTLTGCKIEQVDVYCPVCGLTTNHGRGISFISQTTGGANCGGSTSGGGTSTPHLTQPPVAGQCMAIKFYKGTTLLDANSLKALKPGDVITIAVKGSNNPAKARFRINGSAWAETTKKNSQGEYVTENYTIPQDTVNFTFAAEVYVDNTWK